MVKESQNLCSNIKFEFIPGAADDVSGGVVVVDTEKFIIQE